MKPGTCRQIVFHLHMVAAVDNIERHARKRSPDILRRFPVTLRHIGFQRIGVRVVAVHRQAVGREKGFLGTVRLDALAPVVLTVCKMGAHMIIGGGFGEVGFCGDNSFKRIACVGFLPADRTDIDGHGGNNGVTHLTSSPLLYCAGG